MRKGMKVRLLGGKRTGTIILKSKQNVMVLWDTNLSYTWQVPNDLERV